MPFLHEDRLIRLCAPLYGASRSKNEIERLLSEDLNWGYILKKSGDEGIACLLYHNLSSYRQSVPHDEWGRLERTYYANARRNILLSKEMKELLSSLYREGLKAIPLKGLSLAEEVYKNIALRSMGDIDLLVKREDLMRIKGLLEKSGYRTPIRRELLSRAIERSYMNSMDYFKDDEGSPAVHLHWHIVNTSLPTYMYTKKISMDNFWKAASPANIAGAPSLRLSPYHLIIYLAEHGLKHSFDKLIHLSDIDAAIKRYGRELDWRRVVGEAEALCMEKQLFYGLYFSKYFLDTDIPLKVLSRLRPERLPLLEKPFFRAVSNDKRGTKLCYFVYLNMIKSAINKLRFLFRTIFPPSPVLALFFNLNRPRVTLKDYLLYLRKQFSHLKNL